MCERNCVGWGYVYAGRWVGRKVGGCDYLMYMCVCAYM